MPAIIVEDSKTGELKAMPLPPGRRPEDVAKENGKRLVDYHESLDDARIAIAGAPTGKITWL